MGEVFVHGGPGSNFDAGGPDLESLGVGRTLILYDQRGGGRSDPVTDPRQSSVAQHVRDLEALRQAFALKRLSLARLLEIRDADSQYCVEQPGLFFPAARGFLNGHWPPRATRLVEPASAARLILDFRVQIH